MIKYIYKCNKCGVHFWWEQSMNSKPLTKCIMCGEESLTRVISGGNGFIISSKSSNIETEAHKRNKYTYSMIPYENKTQKKECPSHQFIKDNIDIINKFKV
jgi:putative FmdB family regulatory protein